MMECERIYELSPRNGRKSFYQKAYVHVTKEGDVLYSYGTKIMVRKPDGKMYRCWDDWSMTTGTHIKSFCGLTKKEYEALPFEEEVL